MLVCWYVSTFSIPVRMNSLHADDALFVFVKVWMQQFCSIVNLCVQVFFQFELSCCFYSVSWNSSYKCAVLYGVVNALECIINCKMGFLCLFFFLIESFRLVLLTFLCLHVNIILLFIGTTSVVLLSIEKKNR